MRLVTYSGDGQARAGVQTEGGVLDAAGILGVDQVSVRQLIADRRLEELDGAVGATDAESVSGAELLPPLPDPD